MTAPNSVSSAALNHALVEMARDPSLAAGERDAAFRQVTFRVAQALSVQRSSIWLYNDLRNAIVCQNLFQASDGSHSAGLTLTSAAFPAYFKALDEERIVNADVAVQDPRTREFADVYLMPLGITSLDAPIASAVRLSGSCAWSTSASLASGPLRSRSLRPRWGTSWGRRSSTRSVAARSKPCASAELFRAVTHTATDAIIGTDAQGLITVWNGAAMRMFGVEEGDALGKPLEALVTLDQGEALGEAAARHSAARGYHRACSRLSPG